MGGGGGREEAPRARPPIVPSLDFASPLPFARLFLTQARPRAAQSKDTHTSPRTHPFPSPPPPSAASDVSPAAIAVTLTPHGSSPSPRTAVPAAGDGSFAFPALPPGSHLLEVTAPGLAYHPVWVWVREAADGGEEAAPILEAAYADAPARLVPTTPLTLRPAARTSPFDARATFDPVAFAKTPYGLLLIFVAFAVFALPRLRIDPDEYEELMAEQRERRAGRVAGGGGGGEGEGAAGGARRAIQPPGLQQRRGGGGAEARG